MLRFLIQGSQKMGWLGTAILGMSMIQPLSTLALPEAQVLEKLDNVPTFTIIDQEGKFVPLQLNPRGSQNRNPNSPSIPLVFINPQDATDTLESLTRKQPQLRNSLRVYPVKLSEIYQIFQESQQKKSQRPPVQIVPILPEVRSAATLLTAAGTQIEKPEDVGIPLFYAVVGDKEEYMIRQDINNQSYIPFYWQKQEVEKDIESYKKLNPEAAAQKITIKVTSLEQFVQTLRQNNNSAVEIMQIVPSAEQIDTANRLIN